MLAPSALQEKAAKKKAFLQGGKLIGLFKGIGFHATNAKEADQIVKVLKPSSPIYTMSNLAKPLPKTLPEPIPKVSGSLKMVSVARISPEKNSLFMLNCLQAIKLPEQSSIFLFIYGPINDEKYWGECQQVIDTLPENIKVVYKGSVNNKEVSAVIQTSHILFMPSLGENFGHSIVESLICGRPVLLSNSTPWKNLQEAEAGWNIELNIDEFNRAILAAVSWENATFNKYCRGAFSYAQRHISNPRLIEKYKEVYSTV
jgi:glycosyltransferase involved in cell wall biosynthesis